MRKPRASQSVTQPPGGSPLPVPGGTRREADLGRTSPGAASETDGAIMPPVRIAGRGAGRAAAWTHPAFRHGCRETASLEALQRGRWVSEEAWRQFTSRDRNIQKGKSRRSSRSELVVAALEAERGCGGGGHGSRSQNTEPGPWFYHLSAVCPQASYSASLSLSFLNCYWERQYPPAGLLCGLNERLCKALRTGPGA